MERGNSWPICKAKPLKGKENGDKEMGEPKDVKITQHVGWAEEEMKTRLSSVFYDQKNLTLWITELLWLSGKGHVGSAASPPPPAQVLGAFCRQPRNPSGGRRAPSRPAFPRGKKALLPRLASISPHSDHLLHKAHWAYRSKAQRWPWCDTIAHVVRLPFVGVALKTIFS